MPTLTYIERRGQLETYFDRTALSAWARLTSDAPLGRIRATVRAGRDGMRATLLDWLPADLTGRRILDAGCGTGALAVAAARRGAEVVAIDLSPTLVELARERAAGEPGVTFLSGDMLDSGLGEFDHIVAMDSLIHYREPDMARVVGMLAARTRASILMTFAPRTTLLAMMHMAGRLFPRSDRAPAIEPIRAERMPRLLAMDGWAPGRSHRIANGFYISQAFELVRG
ncbi:MAG: magnesium protoporphyrin IX methyltransferase [Proteobacteria bacterium]|nr:magnesium protoporphyrin IX methyltransferase [Pseudomonadota bacterium]